MSKSVNIEKVAEILNVVSAPIRLKMILLLSEQERNVLELAKLLGTTQSRISHRLRDLRFVGVVNVCKIERNKKYYCLTDLGKQIVDIINKLIKKEG